MPNFRDFKGWDAIRTAIVATFVAMLVWVWAEGESVARRRITLLVSLDADPRSEMVYRPDSDEWTRISGAWTRTITIDVEGTPSAIAEAEALAKSELLLGFGQEGMPRDAGDAKVADLGKAIRSLNEIRRLKIVIAGVDPPVVAVEARRMVQRELPLKVELARQLLLDGEASASPSTVTIRVPDTVASRIVDGVQPLAVVSAEELDRGRGDGARSVSASVRLPPSLGTVDPALVDIRPEIVSVSIRIRRETDTYKLPAVPVWFSLPPTEDGGQWTIEVLDKFVSDVTVSGTADQVARIRSGETTVKALVEMATDDLNKALLGDRSRPIAGDSASAAINPGQPTPGSGTISRQVIFLGLPQGVAASAANAIVRVRVTRHAKSATRSNDEP